MLVLILLWISIGWFLLWHSGEYKDSENVELQMVLWAIGGVPGLLIAGTLNAAESIGEQFS